MSQLYELIVAPMTGSYLESEDINELAQRTLDLVNILNDHAASARSPLVRLATTQVFDLCAKLLTGHMLSGSEVELIDACRNYAMALESGDAEGTAAAKDKVLEGIHRATGYRVMPEER